MTKSRIDHIIIIGVTKEGKKFRPSDWAERLCGVMSAFGAERKMKYLPHVGPWRIRWRQGSFRRWPPRRSRTDGLPLHAQLCTGQRPADHRRRLLDRRQIVDQHNSCHLVVFENLGNKRRPQAPFLRDQSAGSGSSKRLDLGRQAALGTRGLVLVDDLLVGNAVEHCDGLLETALSGGLVTSFDCLTHALDGGTQGRTQVCVMGSAVCLFDGRALRACALLAMKTCLVKVQINDDFPSTALEEIIKR